MHCLDPAISATWNPVEGATLLEQERRAKPHSRRTLGMVVIRLDPHLAPRRLKAELVVRSGTDEVRVPIFGLLDGSVARREQP